MTKIGVQAMMLKKQFEFDGPFATLRRLSDLGFSAVEISQIPMSDSNVGEIDKSHRSYAGRRLSIPSGR
jgi:hypothetical protein